MRQRKLKDLDEKLEQNKRWLIENPQEHKGKWQEKFEGEGKIYLEVGCGKGSFITQNAIKNPDSGYIAVEGQASVIVSACQKAEEEKVDNVLFVNAYIAHLEDWFETQELEGVFLNFSDPWPKTKHEKRRLNHRDFLKAYYRIVKAGGFIKIKTDNDELFLFGEREARSLGYEVEEITRDLHTSKYMEENIITEYEKKFSQKGKNINYMKIRIVK